MSKVSGKVTVRRDLHFTPAWSCESGVAFQKKLWVGLGCGWDG